MNEWNDEMMRMNLSKSKIQMCVVLLLGIKEKRMIPELLFFSLKTRIINIDIRHGKMMSNDVKV